MACLQRGCGDGDRSSRSLRSLLINGRAECRVWNQRRTRRHDSQVCGQHPCRHLVFSNQAFSALRRIRQFELSVRRISVQRRHPAVQTTLSGHRSQQVTKLFPGRLTRTDLASKPDICEMGFNFYIVFVFLHRKTLRKPRINCRDDERRQQC